MNRSLPFALSVVLAAAAMVSCSRAPAGGTESSLQSVPARSLIVQTQTVPQLYQAVGTVESQTTSILGAQLSAAVKAISVRPGDRARKGQLLALLDDRAVAAQWRAAQQGVEAARQSGAEAQQSLAGGQAELHMAEITFHRYQGLWRKSSVSRQELDQTETHYKAAAAHVAGLQAQTQQAAAALEQAQSQQAAAHALFTYTRIVSPLDGIVTAKNVDVGTLVMPGTPLITIEDPSHYRLVAGVPERYHSLVKLGEPVRVTVGEIALAGRVAEIVPAADPASRTFIVKFALPQNGRCRSGEYGAASFPIGQHQEMLIPGAAIVDHGELAGVFVINARNVAHYRLVKTGEAVAGWTEIVSGLAAGEKIAVSDLDRLSDGSRVEAQ